MREKEREKGQSLYSPSGEAMDASAVKRMLLSFEKKVLKNQEMRIKFPDMPEKFMESELELNDEIQTLHVIATVPEYYPVLVETNTIQTLMGLLSHDNSDVAIAVIDLLQEMTDVDTVNESEEEAEKLIEAMLEEQVYYFLVVDVCYIQAGFIPGSATPPPPWQLAFPIFNMGSPPPLNLGTRRLPLLE